MNEERILILQKAARRMCSRFGLTEFANDFAQHVALDLIEKEYDGPVALHLIFNNWLRTHGPFSAKKKREVSFEYDFISKVKESDLDFELFLNSLHQDARIVCTLRVKWGLELTEIAHVMGVSVPTVKRRWTDTREALELRMSQRETFEERSHSYPEVPPQE